MNKDIFNDFPLLKNSRNSVEPIIYLDNASTTLKPDGVIQRLVNFYENEYSNVHRGVYPLAEKVSEMYQNARKETLTFLNSSEDGEVVFTSSTTDSINTVAFGFLADRLKGGDEVLISRLEHHSNWLPWQQVCLQKGARLKIIELNESGQLDWKREEYWTDQLKFIALTQVSNVTGIETPFQEIIQKARSRGIPILVDGAQGLITKDTNLEKWDPDFYVFSGHKVLGPMGVGVLYLKKERLESMRPFRFGGGMVKRVTVEDSLFKTGVQKMESGTPNVSGVIGMIEGFRYLENLNKNEVILHIQELGEETIRRLNSIDDIKTFSKEGNHSGIISFYHKTIHSHDLATFLGKKGICVRAGHHCAQPLLSKLGVGALVRASFSIYNTMEEVEKLEKGIIDAIKFFKNG